MKKITFIFLLSIFCSSQIISAQSCITNLFVETTDCQPDGIHTGFVFFEHSPNVDSVDITYDGAFFGTHSTANLPIALFPLFEDGTEHTIIVEDHDIESCADTLAYYPFCEPGTTCSSEILSVSSFCIDTVLSITLNYNFIAPVSEVHIRVNGEYVINGFVGTNISQTFEVETDTNSVYDIQVLDPEFTNCSDSAFLQVSPCTPACVQQFDTAGTTCNNDGTFNLNFFLGLAEGAVDVYIDSEYMLTTPADSVEIFTISNLASDTIANSYDLTVCQANNTACCTTLAFNSPQCPIVDPCSISNVLVEFDCIPGTLDYNAFITFDHTGIEGDTVLITDYSGNTYGYFDVNQQPIQISTTGVPNQANQFGVVISSTLDPNCVGESPQLNAPCDFTTNCSFENLTTSYECIGNGEYFAELTVTPFNGSGSYDLYVNGQLNGTFPATQNLLIVGPFTNGTGAEIEIKDSQNPDCVEELFVFWQECPMVPCQIDHIEVDSLVCNTDGTYNMIAFYETTNSNSNLVDVYINGEIIDVFPNNGFVNLSQITPSTNSDFDVIKLCFTDTPDCCFEFEYLQPDCDSASDCTFESLTTSYECIDNGEYFATVSFTPFNSSGTYDLYIDNQFNGTFPTSQNIITVGPLVNGQAAMVELKDSQDLECSVTTIVSWSECEFEPCQVNFIEIDSTVCNFDGTYNTTFLFETSNENSDFVQVSINGEFVDIFLNNGSLDFSNITPRENSEYDIIEICVINSPDCCAIFEYSPPNCNTSTECSFQGSIVEYECLGDGGYLAFLSVATADPTGLYQISVDGQFVQMIEGSQNFINIGEFSNGTGHTYTILDVNNPDCLLQGDFFTQDCPNTSGGCQIEYIEVLGTSCNDDNTFNMDLAYLIQDAGNNFIDVYLDGEFFGLYPIDSILTLEEIPLSSSNEIKTITICLNDYADCCLTIDYEQPSCNPINECRLEGSFIEYECLGDGEYIALLSIAITDPTGLYQISVDGQVVQMSQGDLDFVNLGIFGNGTGHTYTILDVNNPDCLLQGDFFTQDCPNTSGGCQIEYIEVLGTSCNDDNTFNMDVAYLIEGAGNNFIDVYLDGEFFGFYPIDSIVTLEEIPLSISTEIKTIKICVNDNTDCCLTVNYNQPDCTPTTEPCNIEIHSVEWFCSSDGDTEHIYFEMDASADMNGHLVFVNGELVLETDFLEQFTSLGPVETNSDGYYVIEVISLSDSSCSAIYELQQAFCPTDCGMEGLEIEIECDESTGTVIPHIYFGYNPDYTNEVIISLNGINLGFYDPSNQPIVVDTFNSNSTLFWEFTVTDSADELCNITTVLDDVFCGGDCIITDLTVDTECIDDETVYFYLDFFSNNTSGEVNIVGNGNQYGSFGVNDLPIKLGPFDPSENNVWEFVVFDVTDDNCQAVIELDNLLCNETADIECIVEGIEVYNFDCIGGNEYAMSVNFSVGDNTNIPFTFYHNGNLMNETNTASLPLNLFGLVSSDSISVETITICLEGLDNCCFDFTYETPDCLSNSVDVTILEGVGLSPNPTRDFININQIPSEVIGLNIIDNHGRSIRQLDAQADIRLDVSTYPEGIYMIQFFTADNRVMSKRFIKMN